LLPRLLQDAVIRVYDDACNVIETQHKGDFKARDAEMQPQRQPAFLRLSVMISQ
jgi:hypothetical protein